MGYLRELLDIRARREQCWWAWEPHLRRTRAVIRAAMNQCAARRKAVVLGSGMLHDVPIDDLASTFREVVLVDIVHPLAARRRRRRFANVHLLTADVTGTVEAVYRLAKVPGAPLPRAAPDLFLDDPEVDLVASVNVLSQLPYFPAKFLSGAGVHPEEAVAAYARDVVGAHLAYLRSLPGTVALISDVENLTVDRAGRVVERESTLYGAELPWAGEKWVWQLAPLLSVNRDFGHHRWVVGIPDVKQAGPGR
jgi:hypothetical protein